MVRDNLKDKVYFDEFITEDCIRINKFVNKLVNDEIKEDRVLPVKIKVHNLKLGVLIAKYSRGDKIEEIKRDFMELIDDWQDVWQSEFYIKNLWMISLGVLLEINSESLHIIRKILQEHHIDDWLYNFLLNYNKESSKIQGTLMFPEVYNELKEIILNQTNRSELLQLYLRNNWYNKHCDCGWYESHKSTQKLYYGYWSFEVGAVVKVLNISDEKLKNEKYYPYELVHWTSEK